MKQLVALLLLFLGEFGFFVLFDHGSHIMADHSDETDPSAVVPGIHPVILEMHAQNDRGAAITGGIYLEQRLREAIEQRWPPVSNTTRDRLFSGYGPLATFSAKINIAGAMGVLNTHAKSDSDKIRLIRNLAAHIGTPFSFDDPKVSTLVDAIHCLRIFPIDEASDNERRNKFTAAVKYTVMYLFFQDDWKKRFGHNAVMPDFGNTESKNRKMKSSSDSNRGS